MSDVEMPVWFTCKRMFLMAGTCARRCASVGNLTPARADLLAVVYSRSVRQRVLKTELGVCASVVSRMLDALEELGLVVREVDPTDRRNKLVRITDRGRNALSIARASLDGAMRKHLGKSHPWRKLPGNESMQFGAELVVMHDWRDDFPIHGARVEPLSLIGQRQLLRRMQLTIPWTNYTGGDFGNTDYANHRYARAEVS